MFPTCAFVGIPNEIRFPLVIDPGPLYISDIERNFRLSVAPRAEFGIVSRVGSSQATAM